MKAAWRWDYNPIRRVYEALFCERKNGDTVKTFSTKKFYSTVAVGLAVANHAHLHLHAESHWIIVLAKQLKMAGLSDGVIGTISGILIGSLDALAVGVKAVYANAKIKGAP